MRVSVSFAIIFGVVPLEISAWKPEIAPQAIVMKTNGYSLPGITGPPPAVKGVNAGMFRFGWTRMTPIIRNAIDPVFRYDDRQSRGQSSTQTGNTEAMKPYAAMITIKLLRESVNACANEESAMRPPR